MRLLAITAFYPPHQLGGYELRCRDVLEGLIKRGHEILVITDRCPDRYCEIHPDEHGIHRVLHQRSEASTVFGQILNDRKDLQFIDRKVKEFDPDIINLWALQNLSNAIFPYLSRQKIQIVYDEGSSGLIYLAKIHKRGIYFYKNESDPIVKKWLKRSIYTFASLISFNLIKPEWSWPANMRLYFNSGSAVRHSQEHGVPVDGASVIHSGIKIAEFPYIARECIHSPVMILVPGRIKPEKGTRDALNLVRELMKRNIPARLRLVGKIQSKEYFDDILGAVHENGLKEVVEYLPMVTQGDLARFYQEADICFFPTYFKTGLSRVPLEAMASGCLVITYGDEGSKEIVRDGETGFIVSEGDVSSAVDLIEAAIKDPDQYRKILYKARVQVEREHTMDKYVDSIEAYLYESSSNNNFGALSG